jgi:hypothetical protein
MQRIPFHSLDLIEQVQQEMQQFREDFKEQFGCYPRQSGDNKQTSSEATFYCGICGHSPISTYPHNH